MEGLREEIEELFGEIDSAAREAYDLRVVLDRSADRARLQALREETAADPVKMAKRRRNDRAQKKHRRSYDAPFVERVRAGSLRYAHELTEAREAVKVDLWFERAVPLPGLRFGVDLPVPRSARLKDRLPKVRGRHAEQERTRRRNAKRADSLPLLELCS